MARNLKRWRQWRGLTQQEMAARLEMEPGAYGHWEGGRVELRARDLVRIAFALKMPLGTLMQALEFPIEDRVLTPGQWVDSGAPAPVLASGTISAAADGLTTESTAGNAASEGAKRPLPRANATFERVPVFA